MPFLVLIVVEAYHPRPLTGKQLVENVIRATVECFRVTTYPEFWEEELCLRHPSAENWSPNAPLLDCEVDKAEALFVRYMANHLGPGLLVCGATASAPGSRAKAKELTAKAVELAFPFWQERKAYIDRLLDLQNRRVFRHGRPTIKNPLGVPGLSYQIPHIPKPKKMAASTPILPASDYVKNALDVLNTEGGARMAPGVVANAIGLTGLGSQMLPKAEQVTRARNLLFLTLHEVNPALLPSALERLTLKAIPWLPGEDRILEVLRLYSEEEVEVKEETASAPLGDAAALLTFAQSAELCIVTDAVGVAERAREILPETVAVKVKSVDRADGVQEILSVTFEMEGLDG